MKLTIQLPKLLFLLSLLLFTACKKDDDSEHINGINPSISDFSLIQQGAFVQGDTLGMLETNIDSIEGAQFTLIEQSHAGVLEVTSNGSLVVAQGVAFDFESDSLLTGTIILSKGGLADTASYHIQITKLAVFTSHWEIEVGQSVQLPLYEGSEDAPTHYNFIVDWGDGTTERVTSFDDAAAIHQYTSLGQKTVSICGKLEGFNFSKNSHSKDMIIGISAWGDVRIGNEGAYFYKCSQLRTFTDKEGPDLSETTRLDSCFFDAEVFNGKLNSWDVSTITDMSHMFKGAGDFNQNISTWDVRNVSTMEAMFHSAYAFNQDVSNWDVSGVTDMGFMFFLADAFNQGLSSWDVSEVTNMSYMFAYAYSFNGDLTSWDISKVGTIKAMFQQAKAFNQDISNWNVSNITDMNHLFNGASSFNQDISNWNVSKVTNMKSMFQEAEYFNQDLSSWDVGEVTDVSYMFFSSSNFNQDLSSWNTAKVVTCDEFATGSSMNDPYLPHLDNCFTGVDEDQLTVFQSKWSLSYPYTIQLPLYDGGPTEPTAYNFIVDWGDGTTGLVTSHDDPDAHHTYTRGGEKIITITGEKLKGFNFYREPHSKDDFVDVLSWGGIALGNIGRYFYECSNLETFSATDAPNLSETTSLSYCFYNAKKFNGDINHWNTSQVTDMSYMFYFANVFNQNLSAWDVSNVTDMSYMFHNTGVFNGDISAWDVGNVTNMSYMFYYARAFNGDISTWDVSKVTNMNSMFCVADVFNKDLSNWDVSNVTDMRFMFFLAKAFNQDLSVWNVSNVTNMYYMFGGADVFNSDLSAWNVSNVTDMSYMFSGAEAFNQDLSAWDVSNVTDMSYMFKDAEAFNQDLSAWNTEKVVSCDYFSSYSGMNDNDFYHPHLGECFDEHPADELTAFKTKWRLTGNFQLQLPIYAGDESDPTYYNFTVDWGDGTSGLVTSYNDPDASHTYATDGEKIVTITGKQLKGFNFYKNRHSRDYLIDIMQWGGLKLGNAGHYFYECSHLETFSASDAPNLSETTSMLSMFLNADVFNGDLSSWDVSNVTDMSVMFYNAEAFNGDLSSWDISNVTDMNRMFYNAEAFNGDLSSWDVSNVTDMSWMFYNTEAFNGDLSSWDVSNVIDMTRMFSDAGDFNGDLSSWNVSKVTKMLYMFFDADAFNSDLSGWNVSEVTDMRYMFSDAGVFNADLSNWNVSKVTKMTNMFFFADAFNQDLSAWNTERVTECSGFSVLSSMSSEHLPTKGSCFGNK